MIFQGGRGSGGRSLQTVQAMPSAKQAQQLAVRPTPRHDVRHGARHATRLERSRSSPAAAATEDVHVHVQVVPLKLRTRDTHQSDQPPLVRLPASRPSPAPSNDLRNIASGLALLFLQSCAFACIVIVQRKVLSTDVDPSQVVALSYTIATMCTALYSLLDGSMWHLKDHYGTANGLTSVLISAVVGAAAYFELLAIASKHLPATLVACSVALEPLLVSIGGAVALGQRTTALEFSGYAFAGLGACSMAWLAGGPGGSDGGAGDEHIDAQPREALVKRMNV